MQLITGTGALAVNKISLSCPLPLERYPYVVLAHGGGGKMMQQLISQMFLSAFGSPANQHDSAVFGPHRERLALTTDSYVVRPLFFPGGDIGKLAVYGTVNDLAMSGASARYLSLAFILEEGLPMETLWRIVQSIQAAAEESGVSIVTGDTKVVERGKGDQVFINTAGVGTVAHALQIGPASIREGDSVIVSGDLGRHGIAVMAAREGLSFSTSIESDCACLKGPVEGLLKAGVAVHCLRDLTRGGLISALNELASASRLGIEVSERSISVAVEVSGACEMLGFDPLYVANEGRFVLFVPASEKDKALEVLRSFEVTSGAAEIGSVKNSGAVIMKTLFGTTRVLDMLSGEQLPRIC